MATKATRALSANNTAILSAIWNEASSDYQRRVPEADQADISATLKALDVYPTLWNEFVGALVNRIGLVVMQTNTWTNGLKYLKKGMMEYGETIEEVRTNLIQAQRYDPNKCYEDVFACNPPESATAFHEINRQDFYPLTVNEPILRRAFLRNDGLQEYLTEVMNTPYTSDEYDEYLIMKNLFKEYEQAYGYYKVQVPAVTDVLNGQQVEDQAKAIAQVIDEYKSLFNFMRTEFNGLHWPTSSKGYDIVVFATPRLASVLRVYVLPFAFRENSAINVNIIEIDDFGIPGCQAIMADERHLMCYDTYMAFKGIENPKGRQWNYFWHHDGIYSLSKFVNAIMFTTETGTVNPTVPTYTITTVTPAFAPVNGAVPTFAPKGTATKLTATVEGTTTPEGAKIPQAVMWSITKSAVPMAQHTYIDSDGWLHVAEDEPNATLTVTATSPYTNAQGDSAVSGEFDAAIGAAPVDPGDDPGEEVTE